MRAFARALGISGGALSEILNGKRGLTPELAARIAPKLPLSDEEREKFISATRLPPKPPAPPKPVRRRAPSSGNSSPTAGLDLDLPKPL